MSATLYEIRADIAAILDLADPDTGEIPEEAVAQLDQLQLDLTDKVEHCCRFIRQCQADAEAYAAETKRLMDSGRAAKNKADRLKRYVKEQMEALGVQVVKSELFRCAIQRNSQPTVTLADDAPIPELYRRIDVSLDRAAVANAAKNGFPLPDGISVEYGSHIRIS